MPLSASPILIKGEYFGSLTFSKEVTFLFSIDLLAVFMESIKDTCPKFVHREK